MTVDFGAMPPWLGWPALFVVFAWLLVGGFRAFRDRLFPILLDRTSFTVSAPVLDLIALFLAVYFLPVMLLVLPVLWFVKLRSDKGPSRTRATAI